MLAANNFTAMANKTTPKILRMVLHKAGFTVNIKGIQRYSIENFMNWKLTGKPQLENPTFIILTDRKDLDEQLGNFFEVAGFPYPKPKTAIQTSIQKTQSRAAQTQPVFASPCAGRESRCGSH